MREFVGRQSEVDLLESSAEAGHVVALVGPSGVGKTTLARHWLTHSPRAGQALEIDCQELDPIEAAAAICEATQSMPAARISDGEFWARAASSLDGVDTLLLDDAAFDLEALDILVQNWSGAVIVTRHRPPRHDAIRVLPVQPLEVPTADELFDAPAGQLFSSVARATDLRFDPEPSKLLIAEIVASCDGFPLAITLAARLSATLSCENVRELLARGDYPADAARPPRHRTMRAAVEFTWDQLDVAQKRRLFAMSLFSAALSTTSLAALCGEDIAETSSGVHELVRMGLVCPGPHHRPLSSFAELAREIFPAEYPQQTEAVEKRMLHRAVSTARSRLETLTDLHEFGDEAQLWDAALPLAERLDDDALGAVLACWTHWLGFRVSAERRQERLDQTQSLFERADNWHAWQQLVWVHLYERDARAPEIIERAKKAAATPEQMRDTLVHEGHYHHLALRQDEARRAFELAAKEAEPTFRYHFFNADLLVYEGRQDEASVQLDRAERLLGDDAQVDRARIEMLRAWCEETAQMRQTRIDKALSIYRDHGMLSSQAWCTHWLATSLAHDEDRFEEAWSMLEKARQMYRAIGRTRQALVLDTEEASLRLHAGQWAEALELSLSVEADVAENDVMPVEPARLLQALCHWQLGDVREAQQLWRADRDYWLESGHSYLQGLIVVFDVVMLLEEGNVDEARERAEDADDETTSRLEAIVALETCDFTDFETALELWPSFRNTLDDPPGTPSEQRFIAARLRANLPPLLARLHRLETDGDGVLILDDFRAFKARDPWVDISAQSTARSLLELLCTRDEPLDFEAIAEVLYPDEVVTHDALVNRINVQMSKLRRAGLKQHIVKADDGFVFDGAYTLG